MNLTFLRAGFRLSPTFIRTIINREDWKKLLGFRNMQEKLEKIRRRTEVEGKRMPRSCLFVCLLLDFFLNTI